MHRETIEYAEEGEKNTLNNNNRKNYVDAVKGIAIMAIIAGHLGIDIVERFVFTFHVPVFFVISGLFYTQYDGIVKKRFKQMIKPYFFTSLLCYVLTLLRTTALIIIKGVSCKELIKASYMGGVEIVYGSGSRTDFFTFELQAIGAIWFFLALIWATLFVFMIEKVFKNIVMKYISVIVVFAVALISAKYVWLPFSVQAGMSSTLFFFFGYECKRRNVLQKRNRAVNCFFISLWLIALYYSYKNDNMSVVRSYFPNVIINILGAISASLLLLMIIEKIESKIASSLIYKFVCWFGKNSLIVLCFHLLENRFFPWHFIFSKFIANLFLYNMVVLVLKIGVTSLLTHIVLKNQNLKKLFV